MSIADLKAQRDRLNQQIRVAEAAERTAWNDALAACEDAVTDWLRGHSYPYGRADRKNVTTWDIAHGTVTVAFAVDDGEHGHGLRVTVGETLALEWSQVPDPAQMVALVAFLTEQQARE